jgi:uncharacterized phiE125 gp8 family phage protein
MGLEVYTAPALEPVSLTEAKAHLRVDITDDDTLITALITSAREMVEQITRRALISQTLDYKIDDWPGDYMELPMPKLISITSITYKLYSDGSTSTLSSAVYFAVTSTTPGRVALKPGQSWPGDSLYPYQAITVRYVAGYGSAASSVPGPIKEAIKLLIGHLYENREASYAGNPNVSMLPMGVDKLLYPYRVFGW